MIDVGPADNSSTEASVRDLVEEVRRREEVVRSNAQELARLRHNGLAAINEQATHLLTAARSDIAAIVVNTRRRLTELSVQAEAIGGAPTHPPLDSFPSERGVTADPATASEPHVSESAATRERLIEIRQSVHRLLDETRPELESLRQDAHALSGGNVTAVKSHHAGVRTEPAPPADPVPLLIVPAVELPRIRPEPPAVELPRIRPEPPAVASPRIRPEPILRQLIDPPQKRGPMWTAAIGGLATIGIALAAATGWKSLKPAPRSAATPTVVQTAVPSTASALSSVKALDKPAGNSPVPARRWSLRVETRATVWIHTTVDGRSEPGRLFRAGEIRTIEPKRDVSLRVGNAGAVFVSIAGSESRALGRDGEVATRRFAVGEKPSAAANTAAPPPPVNQGTGIGTAGASAVRPPQQTAAVGASGPRGPMAALTAEPAGREANRPTAPSDPGGLTSSEVTTAAQRWLDGYYRADAGLMASLAKPDLKISDDRPETDRFPPDLNVRRTLDRVTTQFVGEAAILSGRMTDQATVDGQVQQHVSWVSLVWMREAGVWRVMDVQIISDAKLAKVK